MHDGTMMLQEHPCSSAQKQDHHMQRHYMRRHWDANAMYLQQTCGKYSTGDLKRAKTMPVRAVACCLEGDPFSAPGMSAEPCQAGDESTAGPGAPPSSASLEEPAAALAGIAAAPPSSAAKVCRGKGASLGGACTATGNGAVYVRAQPTKHSITPALQPRRASSRQP